MPQKSIKTTKTEKEKEAPKPAAAPKGSYIWSVGRRKRATACVKMFKKGQGNITVNGKDYKDHFPYFETQKFITDPLSTVNQESNFDFQIKVTGGGQKGQAEAARLAIARALEKLDKELRPALKKKGYLKMDARKKERKKPGLKRARRAPQWKKR